MLVYRNRRWRDPRPRRFVVPLIARLAEAAAALSSGHGPHERSEVKTMHGEMIEAAEAHRRRL